MFDDALAQAFAAHAARAVERERRRIIQVIQTKQRQYAESAKTVGFSQLWAVVEAMQQLADQLENERGK